MQISHRCASPRKVLHQTIFKTWQVCSPQGSGRMAPPQASPLPLWPVSGDQSTCVQTPQQSAAVPAVTLHCLISDTSAHRGDPEGCYLQFYHWLIGGFIDWMDSFWRSWQGRSGASQDYDESFEEKTWPSHLRINSPQGSGRMAPPQASPLTSVVWHIRPDSCRWPLRWRSRQIFCCLIHP